MHELFSAIKRHFESKPIAAKCSGLFAYEAPQNTGLPYVTWMFITGTPERTFGERFENGTFQFSIWSDESSMQEVTELYALLTQAFDDAVLTIAGHYSITVDRVSQNLLRDPDIAWHYQLDYSIQIQEV